MSEKDLVAETLESFELGEFIAGNSGVPMDQVTVYLDSAAAYELNQLYMTADRGDEVKSIVDETGEVAPEAIEVAESLRKRLDASALVIHMRAVNQAEREVIRKSVHQDIKIPQGASEEKRAEIELVREEAVFEAWLAASLVKLVRGKDGVENTDVGLSDIQLLRKTLYDSEWAKVEGLFGMLSFTSALVDQAIDAGFPGGAPTQT